MAAPTLGGNMVFRTTIGISQHARVGTMNKENVVVVGDTLRRSEGPSQGIPGNENPA
jgi:hypothetical protein